MDVHKAVGVRAHSDLVWILDAEGSASRTDKGTSLGISTENECRVFTVFESDGFLMENAIVILDILDLLSAL